MSSKVVVLDLGGGLLKAGIAGQPGPKVFPNGVGKCKGDKRSYTGAQIMDECQEISSMAVRRPFDRGYLINLELQKEVLAHTLRSLLNVDPGRSQVVVTEPVLNFPQLQAELERLFFEHYGFQSVCILPSPVLALMAHSKALPALPANAAGCGLVVDAGFSFTHAVPIFNWQVLARGVQRINLGGRALTNYMKELVSFRSINLMDETFLVEHIKDQVLFISQDLPRDLEKAKLGGGKKSPYRMEYLLPDGVKEIWGRVLSEGDEARPGGAAAASAAPSGPGPSSLQPQQPPDNILQINNERFVVPEALFSPGDLGLQQAGVAEAVMRAVGETDPALHPLLYSNVLVVGGSARIPGFVERLRTELRPLVPDSFDLQVHCPQDPLTYAWQGGSVLGSGPDFSRYTLTRDGYRRKLAQQAQQQMIAQQMYAEGGAPVLREREREIEVGGGGMAPPRRGRPPRG